MNDRIFIDTNLLVYYANEKGDKLETVKNLLKIENEKIISTQIIGEFINTSFSKTELSHSEILKITEEYIRFFKIANINSKTIIEALRIKERYKYSFWDSQIIATALENNCNTIYSEDMHHGQIIDKKLKIVNPFKTKKSKTMT